MWSQWARVQVEVPAEKFVRRFFPAGEDAHHPPGMWGNKDIKMLWMIHNTAPFQTCHRGEEEGPHSNKSPSIHRNLSDKILPSHDWFFVSFFSQWQNPFLHTVIEWIIVVNRKWRRLKKTFPLSPTVRHKHEFCKGWICTLLVLSAKLFLWGIVHMI